MTGVSGRALRWIQRTGWYLAVLLLIVLTYVWLATAGTWRTLPVYYASFERLAEAFLVGRPYILQPPNPALLTKADPYDQANSHLWMVDLSLWQGRYYLYWGPVPPLLLAVAKLFLGRHRVLGEAWLALLFVTIAGLAGAIFVRRICQRLFPGVPRLALAMAMLAVAFAGPLLHLLTTGNTYVIAIAAGQAFLVLGALMAFEAFWSRRSWGLFLLLASASWGLAVGSRASLAPAVAILALVSGLLVAPRKDVGSILRSMMSALGPLATLSAVQLWYNWIRFDNIFEFGTRLQTGFFKFSFDAKYLFTNAYTYVLRPPALSCHFPYFLQEWFPKDQLPFRAPRGYLVNEPVVGLIWSIPILLLVPFGLWSFRFFWRNLGARGNRAIAFLLIGLVFCVPAALAVPLGLYMATIRYQGDAVFALMLLSVFGYFSLWTKTSWWTRSARLLATALMLHTVLAGLALGYQGYNGHLHVMNHDLDRQLRRAFSFCDRGTPAPRFLPNGNMRMD